MSVDSYTRIPPQNLLAEQAVLGAMMLSKDAIGDVVGSVEASDFYKPQHEVVFEAIMRIYSAGDPVDALTVSAALKAEGTLSRVGGGEYLHTLIAVVPSAASAGYYARLVREQSILRRLVEAGTRIAAMGYEADGSEVDDIVNGAQSEIFAVTERRDSGDYRLIGDLLESTLDQVEASSSRGAGMLGIPSGLTDLDRLTGGLREGQMVVVAARPAIGKSTLGLDFARAAAVKGGITTAVFSLEMSNEEITKRLISAEGGIKLESLSRGPMTPNEWEQLSKTVSEVSDAPLFLDDSPNMSIAEIRAKCRRLKQQHSLGLVVVDYLQLMSSGKRVESRQQEVSEFSRALKLLAKEIGVPVVALSQLNRNSEARGDKKPMLSDMRESGAIEQDADIVILLHREDFYDPYNRPGEADLIVAKHRNGPTDTITVVFQGAKARFVDMGPN